jgi:acyl-CoA synthetase (NDP forming)
MDGIERLLRPRSIAVIGGGTWCANVIEQCRKIGFAGDLWAVHPTKARIGGLTPVPRIEDLPQAPDSAFIGINRDSAIEAVRALSALGAGGAVCFASGFREAQGELGDGADKQAALLEAAGDMTILGPNCYGFVNYLDGAALWPDQHGGTRVDRGVALVTQSSNIAINLTMQTRGLPIAYVVTAGNQAQIGVSGIAEALLHDDRVTALGLHIEGIDDLARFERMAGLARRLGKPVVALKVGVSDQAKAATISHTASLAGSDAGASALLSRLGVGRVRTLPEVLETLKLLHLAGPLPSARVSVISCSGGEASLTADTAAGSTLELPALSEPQRRALRATLGPKVALANPLDYHTYIWGNEVAMTDMFAGMLSGDASIGLAIMDFPRSDRCDASAWEPALRAAAAARTKTGTPLAIIPTLPETVPEALATRLARDGLVPLLGLGEALRAIEIAAELGRDRTEPAPVLPPRGPGAGAVLTEAEAKAALAASGLRIPRSGRAKGAEAAAESAARIGFPVVLKGEGIAHKTEAGAVVLNLQDAAAVEAAARAMTTESFLVEEMIPDGMAELLVGVVADPAHGYVLTLAAGGTLTELLDDRAHLLLPTSREAVRAALLTLRIAPLLRGYRGKPPADLDAILDAVDALQAYVIAHRPLEVEVNPLICTPDAAIAADALIRTGD